MDTKTFVMTNFYFDIPKQVLYWESAQRTYNAGIAFHDYTICAGCGTLMENEEIVEDAKAVGKEPFYVYDQWVPLGNETYGDERPVDMPDDEIICPCC